MVSITTTCESSALGLPPKPNGANMKKTSRKLDSDDDMLPEYDFSNGERGRYAKHFAEGGTITFPKSAVKEPKVTKPKKKS